MASPSHRSGSWRSALVNLIGRGRAPFPAVLALLLAVASIGATHGVGSELFVELAIAVLTAIFGVRIGAILLLAPLVALVSGGTLLHHLEWFGECVLVHGITASLVVLIARDRTAQAHLRAMLRPMTDAVFTLDREGRFLAMAPTAPSQQVWPAETIVGKRVAELFPELADEVVQQIRLALDTDTTVPYEYTIPVDGRPTVFSAWITRLSDDAVVWVARDVTAQKEAERIIRDANTELAERRKAAEEALLVSKERYRSIVDQSNEIIYTISSHGVITSLNPAFERTLGWNAEAWIGRFFADLVPPDQPQFDPQQTASVPFTRTVLLAKDGRRVTVETSLRSNTLGAQTLGYVGVARDVTEREQAEEKLRQSDERFRLVARAANDVVWDHDVATDTTTYGEGLTAFSGFRHDEIVGGAQGWIDRVHPDDRERVLAGVEKARNSTQDSWSDEYRYCKKNGDWVVVHDRAQILRDAEGRPVRYVGAITDITERKQLEQQLAQSRRVAALGRVAASIAHEFNNVLMSIQPNVEVIRRRTPEPLGPTVERITRAVQRGKRITEQILSYTRSAQPRFETVDVKKFLRQWEDDARPLLGETVPVRLSLPQAPLWMKADALQIGQVLTNLAINARDAMSGRNGGSLTIAAEHPSSARTSFTRLMSPGDYVYFSVTDEGTGMTPEQLAQLFEPLYTTKSHGTGLGLAISYQLVSSHGGHIFAESEVGRGTTFHLFLPAAEPVLEAVPEEKHAPTARRVLLVEDEEAVAFGMQSLLELDGIQVEVVDRGGKAVERIAAMQPDAVILDVGLPDMDGVAVYREIEARWPDLPVIFSSGHADASKLEAFLSRANVAFLLKPYAYDALLETMTALMERKVA